MILYQYKKIDKYTLEMLINNEFYYPFPHEFNDPFDSLGFSSYPQSKKDLEKFFAGMMREGRMSLEEVNNFKNYFEKVKYDPKVIKKYFAPDKCDIFRENMIIKCFTALNNNILMWSHYAQCHKGICIGFEVKPEPRVEDSYYYESDKSILYNNNKIINIPIWKVIYPESNQIPEFNPFEKNMKAFNFLTLKYKGWSYEQEYRSILVFDSINTRFIKFKKEILKEIIFGLDTKQDDIKTIRTIVDEKYSNVNYKKAKRLLGKYDLEFENIN